MANQESEAYLNPTTGVQSANVNGMMLHWLEKGRGEPVILIPGAICDYRSWSYQTEEFAQFFRVISLSRRYQFPEKYPKGGSSSIADNCTDLLELFRHLNLEKATLVGHSYGGYIALAFAEKYPEKVNKLVLIEPSVFGFITNSPYNPFKLIPLAQKDLAAAVSMVRSGFKGVFPCRFYLKTGQYDKAKLAVMEGLTGHKVSLDDINGLLRQTLEDNILTFEGDSRNAFDYPLTKEKLKAIHIRTLLLASRQSPRWFGFICRELRQFLPSCELIFMDSPTHWLHLDLPGEFNQIVIRFLSTNK